MHPHLKSLLVKAGCDENATDEDAQKFYDGLSEDKKSDMDGQVAKLMDGDGDYAGASARATAAAAAATSQQAGAAALSQEQIVKIATQAAVAALATMQGGRQQNRVTNASNSSTATQSGDDDDEAVALEEQRVGRIRKIGALHKIPDGVLNSVIAESGTFEDARRRILKHVQDNAKPIAAVSVGDDKRIVALRAALPQAIIMRAGVEEKAFEKLGEKVHEEARKFRGQSMLDMFRVYLVGLGCDANQVYSMSRAALADTLGPRKLRSTFPRLAALAESTSDFGNITLDAINKTLRFNYLDAKRTWPIWAEKKFAPDFKTINSIALSEAPNMVSANEAGEMQYVSLSDSKETAKLVTYKAGIRLTRNAIINDDLDAFNAIPRLQANSAARLEDDVAYKMITNNSTMADGGALFNATAVTSSGGHSNLTASGAAPSVSQLQTGATSMMKQKGLANAARLELEPKFLLVPTSIVEQTKELIGSSTLIAQYTAGSGNPTTVGDKNPFFNRYQVVGSTRLDDSSATKWYLLADYRDGQINTFQLYFLTDEPEPVLRSETDFDSEDVKYLVRHTVVGLVPDFRGAYANNGA